jgi:peptide chain release factor 3
LAGDVKARGERRRVRSDWMAVEYQRGISVSSGVMSFEHKGSPSTYWTRRATNISAHCDFSENTTAMPTAVVSALIPTRRGVPN